MILADAALGAGQLMKIFPSGAGNFTFPIGDNAGSGNSHLSH